MSHENSNNNTDGVTTGGSVVTGIVFGILATAFFGPLLFLSITNPELGSSELESSAFGILTIAVGVVGMGFCRSALLRLDQELELQFKVLFGLSVVIAALGLASLSIYVAQVLPTLANFN